MQALNSSAPPHAAVSAAARIRASSTRSEHLGTRPEQRPGVGSAKAAAASRPWPGFLAGRERASRPARSTAGVVRKPVGGRANPELRGPNRPHDRGPRVHYSVGHIVRASFARVAPREVLAMTPSADAGCPAPGEFPRPGAALGFDLTMAFQPIVDLDRREVYSYEALVRGPQGQPAAH